MNAQRWLRENINVDMMAWQKLAIGACAESTDWTLLTNGMSLSLEKFESSRRANPLGF